ncbi:MAG: hypothetical protein K5677_08685 [Ruminococcus sp.]|nr:hypothetical protein [Ruminococcus sp.]
MSIGQIYAEDRAAEEALRNELLSYTEDYPEGAIAFYEESTTIKEGDSDKEVTIVRLGDPSEAMSVDVKAYDVTAQYGADYTLYTKIKRKKNYADDSQVAAPKVQAAMEDGTFKDMLEQDGEAANTDSVTGEPVAPTEELPPVETPAEETAEDDSEYEIVEAQAAEQAETEQSSGEKAEDSMRGAFRQQTGKDTVNTNWRGEYEQEQLERAAMEADNEVVDSFDGAFLTLDFEPGEYKKTVYVHIEDDDKGEITESTALVLGNATLGVIGVNMQYTVNIEDNEPDEPVTFAMKEAEIVTDRSASYAEVTVERVTGMDYYASLNWRTASGTAESMDAYIPVDNGNVSFAPGQTEATVRVELTEAAQVGTYFTVLIDEDKNITEEKRKSTKVWIGSTKANEADVLEEPDMFPQPQPQPLPKPSLPAAVSAPIVNASSGNNKNVVYSVPSSVLSTPKYTSQGQNFNIPELKGARFVRVEVKASYINRTSALDVYAGNELIGWKVVDKPRYSFEEVNVSGLFALKSTDCTSLRLTADFWYEVTAIQIYYPSEYTFITLNEDQKLTGKKYTSLDESTEIKVPAIPNWKSSFANEPVTVSKTTPKKQLQNFSSRLQNGVKVESAEAYIGKPEEHEYIKDIKIFYVYHVSWEDEMKIMHGEYTYEGYSIVSNWEMTYYDVMIGIKTTKNPSEAIKDIHVFTGLRDYGYASYSYEKVIRAGDKITYLNRNYEPVPTNKDQQNTDTRFGKISNPISTADALFLYYTREDDGSGYSLSTLKRWEEKDSSYVPVAEIDERNYIFDSRAHEPFKELSFTKFRSNYLGTITGIKDGYLDYNSMSMICSNAAQMDALNANNNTIYLIPKYTTMDAEVSFKAEDATAVSFNGNKGEKGFKNGDVLKCKMIDQVTMTAVDVTKNQKINPANIRRESYYGVNNRSKTTKNVFAVNSTTSSRLSTTVDVDYPKEEFTAVYNRPTLTIQYDADENAESKPSRKFGDVMLSAFNEPSKILGHSNYLEPFTYKAPDLSMLHSSYLLSAQIDDSKMHQILYDKAGQEYQMSTRTTWTFRDKKTGEDKTLTGNSMVFKPYYGTETVEYFFEQREDNAKPVGISGKVYTYETPLFAVEGTEAEKKAAVGVTLNIGGYNTYTDAKGQYSIGQFFNKGDHVAGYAQYNSISEVMDIGISKDTVYDFDLDINGLDGIRVKSSSMQKKAVVNKGSLPFGIASGANQYTYAVQDESIMTQEDAEYYLHLSVESDAGIVPDYAEFRVYSKNGDLRPDLTKQVDFVGDSLTYTLNPMSMSESKKLEVGDTFTVTLYDKKGNKYYEHHTDILVAEALNGMYMFNYKGKEHDDNDTFLNAMGNISIAYTVQQNL